MRYRSCVKETSSKNKYTPLTFKYTEEEHAGKNYSNIEKV